MTKIIENPGQYFNSAKAEEIAKRLQANDPDWTYRAVHAPNGNGLSYVAIFDEDGQMIGKY
jgi:hypothetical protein